MKRVRCATSVSHVDVGGWPGVVEATREGERLCIATEAPEAVLRRLLALDPDLASLEVRAAGLAEAFTELTREDAVQEAA